MNGRDRGYRGDIILVGINYDEDKGHECIVEDFDVSKVDSRMLEIIEV